MRQDASRTTCFDTAEVWATMLTNGSRFARLWSTAPSPYASAKQSAALLQDRNPAGWDTSFWHVWWAPPDRWRGEFSQVEGSVDVTVVNGNESAAFIDSQNLLITSGRRVQDDPQGVHVARPVGIVELPTITNRHETFPLFRPFFRPPHFGLERLQREVHLDREATRFRATLNGKIDAFHDHRPSGFWPGIECYEFLMDDALQIVVHLEGIVDGEKIASLSISKLIINEQLHDKLFHLSSRDGTRIVEVPAGKAAEGVRGEEMGQ